MGVARTDFFPAFRAPEKGVITHGGAGQIKCSATHGGASKPISYVQKITTVFPPVVDKHKTIEQS